MPKKSITVCVIRTPVKASNGPQHLKGWTCVIPKTVRCFYGRSAVTYLKRVELERKRVNILDKLRVTKRLRQTSSGKN